MAIQFAYSDDKDNDYPASYARIEEINTHFQDRRAHMTVIVYKSQTSMQNNKRAVGKFVYDFSADASETVPAYNDVFSQALYDAKKTDPRKLGYTYLRTIPPFNGGIEV